VIPAPMGIQRYLTDVFGERLLTPQDYGAIADGSTHPLSGAYASLALAQAAYAFSVTGCTFTSGSTTITCDTTDPLRGGSPVSGTNIPAAATVSAITDGTHFVLSANPTGSGSGATLTSSFITSLAQELDYAGTQMAIYVSGSIYIPTGVYKLGSDTIRTTTPTLLGGESVRGNGIILQGAGQNLTRIDGSGDGFHILGGDQSINDLTITGPGSPGSPTFTTANGITLGQGAYSNKFHLTRVTVRNFNIGFHNPSGWDGCSVTDSYLSDNFCNASTESNQDTLRISGTSFNNDSAFSDGTFAVTGGSTHTNTTVNVGSTTGIFPGATISGTDIPAYTIVLAIVDATTITINQAATGTHSGITFHVATIALAVRGSGSAQWDGGVSGGNGVHITGIMAKASGVHFEGGDQIGITADLNGTITLDNCQFADGGKALRHVQINNGSVTVTRCVAFNPGISGSNGRVYVYGGGAPTVLSPDHTAVEDYNAAMQVICGDYFIQTGDNNMPGAAASNRGIRYYQGHYASFAGDDHIFTCEYRSGGYNWIRDDGLIANTSGVVATNTAGGTTGAQTINFQAGSVNFAATDTSLVVTNSLVTSSSIITATVGTNDVTLKSVQAVAGSGSFTLYGNAAATAETRVYFRVLNP
jgi:hypothetical protein